MSKKSIWVATYFCVLALCCLLLVAIGNQYFDTPIGNSAVVDLRADFSKSKTYKLDGNWELFPNVLLAPTDLPAYPKKYVDFPKLFSFGVDNVTNLKPGQMATYRIQVLMPVTDEQLALALNVQGTACRVFINSKALSGEGIDREQLMANELLLRPQQFVFESAKTIEIVVQVLNSDFMIGGLVTAPVFGDSVALQNYRRRLINWDAMIFTLLAMTTVVFALMILSYWKETRMKVFFFLTIIYCILFCCLNERYIFDVLPGLQIDYFRKILFTANLWSILITQLYYQGLQVPKIVPNYRRTVAIMLIAAVIIAVVPVEVLASRVLFWSMLIYGIVVLAKIIWMVLHSTEIGSINWQYLAFGSLCNAITSLQVVLLVLGIGTPISLLAITLMLFMGSQLMNIIERYRSKELSKNLEIGELSYMRAQMNPHFVYNTLNSIASLIRSHPAQARQTVVDFSDYLRKLLKPGQIKPLATVAEELELVENYLRIEKIRFGEKLVCNITLPTSMQQIKLPGITLQPLIENAIKHGLTAVNSRWQLSVSGYYQDRFAYIDIEDNGIGLDFVRKRKMDSGQAVGLGTYNIRERLRRYDGDLRLEAKNPGVKVTIKIPINIKSR